MFYKPLLYPLIIQVALTFLVWFRMYQTRLAEIRQKKIDPLEFRRRVDAQRLLHNTAAADNFANQFEMPVLFYVAVVLSLALMLHDTVIVTLSWMFVGLRVIHSAIHISYNKATHRFVVYLMSSITLLALWARLAWYFMSR